MAWNRWAALCGVKRACLASPERSIVSIWTKLGLGQTKHSSGGLQTLQDARKICGGFNLSDQVGQDGCSGWVFLGKWFPSSRSSQKAARRHKAAQEHSRSARTRPGEPRSSQRPDSRMLQTCGLVSAFSVVETYFLSQSACLQACSRPSSSER